METKYKIMLFAYGKWVVYQAGGNTKKEALKALKYWQGKTTYTLCIKKNKKKLVA